MFAVLLAFWVLYSPWHKSYHLFTCALLSHARHWSNTSKGHGPFGVQKETISCSEQGIQQQIPHGWDKLPLFSSPEEAVVVPIIIRVACELPGFLRNTFLILKGGILLSGSCTIFTLAIYNIWQSAKLTPIKGKICTKEMSCFPWQIH